MDENSEYLEILNEEKEGFEKELYKNKLLSKRDSLKEITEKENSIDESKIFELLDKPKELKVENDDLVFFEDGERVVLSIGTNITEHKTKVSDLLPEVEFNLEQEGNVKRQIEIESIYKCCIISSLFEGLYSQEIRSICKTYNFETMLDSDNGKYPFTQLKEQIELDSNYIMKLVLSACTLKLSNSAAKNLSVILSDLTMEERSKLDVLNSKIKSLVFKYDEKIDLEKDPLQKKVLIAKKDTEVDEIIRNDSIGNIYKIVNLSSEAIPTIQKVKISKAAREFTLKIMNKQSKNLSDDEKKDLQSYLLSRLRKRGWKAFLSTYRSDEYKRYKADPENYKIRTKR